ncbi:hypothetical protein, partial [uncultured Desulfovibrio sp.]|uniref:hypothetical protein n=1 Tax=uncultured Desulfovibrio sp. TaxID=167968 RepID=UPI002639D701
LTACCVNQLLSSAVASCVATAEAASRPRSGREMAGDAAIENRYFQSQNTLGSGAMKLRYGFFSEGKRFFR